MKLFALIIVFTSLKLQAHFPPENFGGDSRGENKNVFVDFKEANSTIVYDLQTYAVSAETKIDFYQASEGHPIFDLIPEIEELIIDGERANAVSKELPEQASRAK